MLFSFSYHTKMHSSKNNT